MQTNAVLGALLGLTLAACTTGTAEPVFIADPATSEDVSDAPSTEAVAYSAPAGDPAYAAGHVPSAAAGEALVACPADGAPTAGCTVMKDIGDMGFGDAVMTCADKQASNGCASKPLSIEWKDGVAATPETLSFAFDTAFFCSKPGKSLTQTVELNGQVVGTFEGNETDCNCDATSRERTFTLSGADMAAYNPAGTNTITIAGPNRCIALRPKTQWNGGYARVVTKY